MTGTDWDSVIMVSPMRLHMRLISFGKYKICLWFVVVATVAVTTTILHMHLFGKSERLCQ